MWMQRIKNSEFNFQMMKYAVSYVVTLRIWLHSINFAITVLHLYNLSRTTLGIVKIIYWHKLFTKKFKLLDNNNNNKDIQFRFGIAVT